jgi:hypothetical protein
LLPTIPTPKEKLNKKKEKKLDRNAARQRSNSDYEIKIKFN